MNLRQFICQLRVLEQMGARSMAFDWRDLDISRKQRRQVFKLISSKMRTSRTLHGFVVYF